MKYTDKNLEGSQESNRAIIERRGFLGQVEVAPIEVRGNDRDTPLGFVYDWAKLFSLPVGRAETVFSLGIWGFTGATVGLFLHSFPILLIPSIGFLLIMGVISYYAPELTPVICLRISLVILMVLATMIVL